MDKHSTESRNEAYSHILRHTQAALSPASRLFSRFIHAPVVEPLSSLVGMTIASPSAIICGALFALLLSGSTYGFALYYGYSLSGFESFAAFLLGWAVGLIIDFIRLALGKR